MRIEMRKRANILSMNNAGKLLPYVYKELSCTKILFEAGVSFKKQKHKTQLINMYKVDEENDLIYTFAGFMDRLLKLFEECRFEVVFQEFDRPPDFEPILDNLNDVKLRKGQEEMLSIMMACDRAQLNGLTALGKSFLIKQVVKLYSHENCYITVCAQQKPIVQALYRDLIDMVPGQVGMCGNGSNDPRRITVCTAKSLMKANPEKTNILLYDEVHTAGAKQTSEFLTNFLWARMYGFSASTECRTDKTDKVVESLFGPVRCHISYQDGVEEGIVPIIDTRFYKIYVPPFQHVSKAIVRRHNTWANDCWNQAIGRIARYWEGQIENAQILILTNAIEHVFRILKYLPGYIPVFAPAELERIRQLQKKGIIDPDYVQPRPREMAEIIQRIEAGAVRRIVSTTTLGTGVDLRHLDVIIRADAGSSEISNIQFRGRVTRGNRGTYCDFIVDGDENERARSMTRMRSCKRAGWDVKVEEIPQ